MKNDKDEYSEDLCQKKLSVDEAHTLKNPRKTIPCERLVRRLYAVEKLYVKMFCAQGAGAADLEVGQMNVERNAA